MASPVRPRGKFSGRKIASEKLDEERFNIEKEISEESLRERRYLWTARAFAIVVAITLCANIVLLLGLFQVLPLTRAQFFYLTFQNKEEQIVSVQPLNASEETMNLVTESYIRQYLVARLQVTSNKDEMLNRWNTEGPVKWMSSDVVFNDFIKTTVADFERMDKEGWTRSIDILSVIKSSSRARGGGDIWQAEVDMINMLPSSNRPTRERFIVYLRVAYYPNPNIKYAYRLKNPLGFTVMQYGISRKSNASSGAGSAS
jgi:type IV secretory pathway component VirB8